MRQTNDAEQNDGKDFNRSLHPLLRRRPTRLRDRLGLRHIELSSSADPASHGDYDFSSRVPLFQIAHRLGDLAERVGRVNDRLDLAGFDQLLQYDEVFFFGCDKNPRSRWRTNGDYTSALTVRSVPMSHGPPDPPTMTRVRLGVRPCLRCDNERLLAMSRTRS